MGHSWAAKQGVGKSTSAHARRHRVLFLPLLAPDLARRNGDSDSDARGLKSPASRDATENLQLFAMTSWVSRHIDPLFGPAHFRRTRRDSPGYLK